MRWTMLPVPDDSRDPKYRLSVRLNSLGSLYFFEKYTLQRPRLTKGLHKPILDSLEEDKLRHMFNLPRDHLKTTMTTEGRSMWRTLPFNELDEICMRDLGYDDSWIDWMKRIHNPCRRILTVSETIGNAIMIGFRFDWHFHENEIFKYVFDDIQPDSKCVWNNESKQIKAPQRGPNGEGTFDFMGVGAALQSRHYTDVNEDDPVGKDAIEQPTTMEKTINYHQLLIGAFDRFAVGAWSVVGNLWAPNDLYAWVKKNNGNSELNRFIIERHSAEGGCCEKHPAGKPIFPEEFPMEVLAEIRRIQGPYYYSHQYLNLAVSPEDCKFKPEWLHFYEFIPSPINKGKVWMKHEVKAGETLPDIDPRALQKSMIVDPNHAEEEGRSHHAIVVTGFDPESNRVYLLDVWARSTSYDELVRNIFNMLVFWDMHDIHLEKNAAQQLLRYPIEAEGSRRGWQYNLNPFQAGRGKGAKIQRIESMDGIYRSGQFYCRHDQAEFLDEYYGYPGCPTWDVLDCLGYAVNTWNAVHAKHILDIIRQRRERMFTRKGHTGY